MVVESWSRAWKKTQPRRDDDENGSGADDDVDDAADAHDTATADDIDESDVSSSRSPKPQPQAVLRPARPAPVLCYPAFERKAAVPQDPMIVQPPILC